MSELKNDIRIYVTSKFYENVWNKIFNFFYINNVIVLCTILNTLNFAEKALVGGNMQPLNLKNAFALT